MSTRIKRIALILLSVCLFAALAAAAVLLPQRALAAPSDGGTVGGTESGTAPEEGEPHARELSLRTDVGLDDGLFVSFDATLPAGYSSPRLTVERGARTDDLTGTETENALHFRYGISPYDLNDTLTASLTAEKDGERQTLVQRSLRTAALWREKLHVSFGQSGCASWLEYAAQRTLATSVLDLASELTGRDLFTYTSAYSESDRAVYTFGYEDLYGSQNWDLREPTFGPSEEGGFENFSWVDVRLDLKQGFYLYFYFTLHGAKQLRARIETAEGFTWTVPAQTGETLADGTPVYAFGYAFDAATFCENVTATVYSGDAVAGPTVEYSVNRAVSKAHASSAETPFTALWALGKAAVWAEHGSEFEFTMLPNLNNDGVYVARYADYVYGDQMLLLGNMHLSENAIWFNGRGMDETSARMTGEGYTLYRASDEAYMLTLSGVQGAEGLILPSANKLIANVTEDSSVAGEYFRTWDDKNETSPVSYAFGTMGDVLLWGENGKTLTISGQMNVGGTLTVQGDMTLRIVAKKANVNALSVKSLVIEKGARVEVVYENGQSSAAGVRITENASVHGSLLSENFYAAMQFGGDREKREIAFTADGEVTLRGGEYGLTAVSIPAEEWNGWQATYWTVQLNVDGKFTVEDVVHGMQHTDLTVGAGEVNITAEVSGIGDNSHPATLRTSGGSPEKGILNVMVLDPENGSYALVAQNINVNGGALHFASAAMNAVIKTAANSVWGFENCDVLIEALSKSHSVWNESGEETLLRPYGIEAMSAGERINIKTSARVHIAHCDIAIECWIPADMSPAAVKVEGDLVVSDYVASQTEWGLTAQIDGNVRYVS